MILIWFVYTSLKSSIYSSSWWNFTSRVAPPKNPFSNFFKVFHPSSTKNVSVKLVSALGQVIFLRFFFILISFLFHIKITFEVFNISQCQHFRQKRTLKPECYKTQDFPSFPDFAVYELIICTPGRKAKVVSIR